MTAGPSPHGAAQPIHVSIPERLALVSPEDARLRRMAQRVERIDARVRAFAAAMFALMRREHGVGLAAPQVGCLLRVIVVDVSKYQRGTPPLTLVNPVVVGREGSSTAVEACLSLPGIEAPVRRARQVRVSADGIDGGPVRLAAEGLLARALQHEIDHLDGILFIDRASAAQRWRLRHALKALGQGAFSRALRARPAAAGQRMLPSALTPL